MAENKTRPTAVKPRDFIAALPDAQRRKDALVLLKLFAGITGEPARMWGASIVGFGQYHYRYESGREGDICLAGFSPRSTGLVLYVGATLADKALLKGLGKHRTGVGCLYINRLEDVDAAVLGKVVRAGVAATRAYAASMPPAAKPATAKSATGRRSAKATARSRKVAR